MAKLWIQSATKVKNLIFFANWLANVTKRIGQGLQLGARLHDGEIALASASEFNFNVDCGRQSVVEEQIGDGAPDVMGIATELHHKIQNFFGDGSIQPIDNGRVYHLPIRINQRLEGGVLM